MSNQLMKIDFNSLSVEEIGYLQDKLMTARVKNIEDSLKRLSEIQSIEIEERKIETQRLDEEIEKTKGMAEAHLRAKQIKYGWVNQGDFGRFFEQSIGSKTMGKLLKVVGLAQKNKNLTTPYRQFIPKYAMTSIQNNPSGYDFTKVSWHFENCIEFINDWLKQNGYYESFYSTKSTKEMENFISQLYSKN